MWGDHKDVQRTYMRSKKKRLIENKTKSKIKNMFTEQQEELQLITKNLLFCSFMFVYLPYNSS